MSATTIQAQMGYAAQASPVTNFVNAAPTNPERFAQPAPQQAVQADIARAPKVTPPQTTSEPSQKPQPVQAERITRKTDIDWTTNSMVYRVIDSRSGQVVSQSPDEALLRMRAYARQVATQTAAEQPTQQSVSREL